jgi:hypothetical protein
MARSFIHEERYVLVVDGQRKASYADSAAAQSAADKIQQTYPRVIVAIVDQHERKDIKGEADAVPSQAPWPD